MIFSFRDETVHTVPSLPLSVAGYASPPPVSLPQHFDPRPHRSRPDRLNRETRFNENNVTLAGQFVPSDTPRGVTGGFGHLVPTGEGGISPTLGVIHNSDVFSNQYPKEVAGPSFVGRVLSVSCVFN